MSIPSSGGTPNNPSPPGSDAFAVPADDRYFEDYQPGATYEFADTSTLDQQRMIEFGTEFDPQTFHVDPEAAGPFGGLIASGWHTAGVMMRLLSDNYLSKVASLASPGIDEIRWLLPVRPGDTAERAAAGARRPVVALRSAARDRVDVRRARRPGGRAGGVHEAGELRRSRECGWDRPASPPASG